MPAKTPTPLTCPWYRDKPTASRMNRAQMPCAVNRGRDGAQQRQLEFLRGMKPGVVWIKPGFREECSGRIPLALGEKRCQEPIIDICVPTIKNAGDRSIRREHLR